MAGVMHTYDKAAKQPSVTIKDLEGNGYSSAKSTLMQAWQAYRWIIVIAAGSLFSLIVVAATEPAWYHQGRRTPQVGFVQSSSGPGVVRNGVTYDPVQAPSYPLAVRNPYLSAWMPGPSVQNISSNRAQFWAGQSLTWSILARVGGTTYNLFGVASPLGGTEYATVRSATYTSTHSIFVLTAGAAELTLDFFNPVSPSNFIRQSLPFSYYTVSATSTSSVDIQIYSDLDSTWTGQMVNTVASLNTTGTTSVFTISTTGTAPYSQSNEQALWGDVIFASRPSTSSTLTVQSGAISTVRQAFVDDGKLSGNSLAWAPDSGVIALSHDLGTVSTVSNVTFAVGYVREEAINYLGTPYTGYYRSAYPDTIDAVSYFLDDFGDASAESALLDLDLSTKSTVVGGANYSDITTLSLVQAYGGIDLVIPNDSLDTSDTLAFIKEISSDGNVNTIDIIMPAFPIYYAMEPEYIRLLLEPVVRYLQAGRWPHPWVIHDIGSAYPNATGHDLGNAEQMPIEETGNLLILAYAYSKAAGNTSWASQYDTLFKGYGDYLAANSINITSQLQTNDAAGALPNETNLAVKAAVGLKAIGAMFELQNFTDIGNEHAALLYADGLATDEAKTHFVLEYPNNKSTYKVTFNLYPDVLLNLSTFPAAAYTMESSYLPTIRKAGGVPIDNRQWWAKSDWNIWAAGTAASTDTREMLVNDVWAFMSNGLNSWPFSDRWVVDEGGGVVGTEFALRARPTVGGHFALLALEGARYLKW